MPNNYILLETIALTQSAASVTFDNLPTSGYTDLKVVVSARGASSGGGTSGVWDGMTIKFNGSSANFTYRALFAQDSAAVYSNNGSTGLAGWIDYSGATANTFASTEVYIPNYLSSNNKSYSIDAVTENNGTAGIASLLAGLWSQIAAITSITVYLSSGNITAGSTFSLYGIAALGTTPVLAPKATGGNIVANDGTYWYHAFTSSGNFVPQVGLTADVLVVAGGGGGGYERGGGGGAGGFLAFTSQALASGTNYACTVGSGGTGGTGYSNVGNTNGNDSQFGSFTLVKGGGYGGSSGTAGGAGGSAGGSGMNTTNTTVITNPSVSGQGSAGGSGGGTPSNYAGGGGGGATAIGANANPSTGGAGSSAYSSWGVATLTGQNVSGTYWYAGGGGGGREYTGSTGGNGGGGNGNSNSGLTGVNAMTNTGGGGGGGAFYGLNSSNLAGAGGSGIVIVRYPIN